MEISWPGDYGEIHTRVLERMRRVLEEDTVYPYLKENAAHRLEVARRLARNTGITRRMLLHLGGATYCLFPWLGTPSFRTLRRFLIKKAGALGLSGMEYEGCCYLKFHLAGSAEQFIRRLAEEASGGICVEDLVSPAEHPLFDKYDALIPGELLRRAYAADRLFAPEAEERIAALCKERG
jgi:ATP-dependent Lhr-like helicase